MGPSRRLWRGGWADRATTVRSLPALKRRALRRPGSTKASAVRRASAFAPQTGVIGLYHPSLQSCSCVECKYLKSESDKKLLRKAAQEMRDRQANFQAQLHAIRSRELRSLSLWRLVTYILRLGNRPSFHHVNPAPYQPEKRRYCSKNGNRAPKFVAFGEVWRGSRQMT
jgi:hypothetical protein